MFSRIVNPKTNRKVNVNSKVGKEILNNYISIQSGGSVRWNGNRFTAGGGQATRQRSRAEIRVLQMLGVQYNGGNGDIQNYAAFWRNPNRRYHQFGYWNNINRFVSMSLNEFIRDFIRGRRDPPSNGNIYSFIRIIELRFLDSRQRALDAGETNVFHNHHDIIIGMLEAFWTLTRQRPNTRMWLNHIDFLEISRRVAESEWRYISRGLISSIMNYQLPEAFEGEAYDTYEQYEVDELTDAFEGMRM